MNLKWISLNKDAPKAGELPELEALGIPFANSPHPMWVYDLQTLAFLEVNDVAIRTYGYTRQEFLRMTLLDIRPATEIANFLQDWRHPHEASGESWRHVGKDGKVFPVSITSWELTFKGRKAELVLARREDRADSYPNHTDTTNSNPVQQKACSIPATDGCRK
ncbi:MAG TPA: PAS domain S-box protein [Terriglobales bacterium]|nr:PAS domain S-box protein [Terriglobales bacterium]